MCIILMSYYEEINLYWSTSVSQTFLWRMKLLGISNYPLPLLLDCNILNRSLKLLHSYTINNDIYDMIMQI